MRKGSVWVVLLSAGASLGLMLRAGNHQPSVVLLLLFTIWVASPFAGLVWAHRRASSRSVPWQRAVSWLMWLVSLGSVATYAVVAFLVYLAKPAGPFLAVPLLSWLVIGVWSAVHARKAA
jgi:type IV secretory pathway VirB2 component (pilin)